MKRTPILLSAVLALVMAACGSDQTDATASPTEAATSTATPTATSDLTPTPSPTSAGASESPDATDDVGALPSFDPPNSAPELLALLPDEVGGVPAIPGFGEMSQTGEEFMEEGDDEGNEEFVSFLQRVGAQPEDVSVAFKLYADLEDLENPESMTSVFAFRVAGADSATLLEEMQGAYEDEEDITWEPANIGGKSVQMATEPLEEGGTMYLYVRDDIVFAVMATDDSLAEDALRQLP